MAKKNNPGCNCCERVLVWDMGRRRNVYEQYDPANDRYLFSYNMNETKEGFFGSGPDGVDYAIPPELIPQSAGGPLGREFWPQNPGYSPYADHSALEDFWTRDIYDYKLIYWYLPQDDTDLDRTSGQGVCPTPADFLTTPDGHPDHPYMGGLPRWWDDVASGDWVGRIVFQTYGSYSSGRLSELSSNVFINTLAATHGMSIEIDFTPAFSGSGNRNVFVDNGTDLGVGVTGMTHSNNMARVTGGETIITAEVYVRPESWCQLFSGDESLFSVPYVQRNTVTIDVDFTGYLKDFVLICGSLAGDGYDKFHSNLFDAPISNDHSAPL